MSNLEFIWDNSKAITNQKKHNISFEEAKSCFYDDNAQLLADPDHSRREEERFILLGRSGFSNMLVVSHCYREQNEIIRIISARKATKSEQKQYWEGV